MFTHRLLKVVVSCYVFSICGVGITFAATPVSGGIYVENDSDSMGSTYILPYDSPHQYEMTTNDENRIEINRVESSTEKHALVPFDGTNLEYAGVYIDADRPSEGINVLSGSPLEKISNLENFVALADREIYASQFLDIVLKQADETMKGNQVASQSKI